MGLDGWVLGGCWVDNRVGVGWIIGWVLGG